VKLWALPVVLLATMVVVGAVGERVVDMMCGLGSWGAKTIERLEYFGA